MTPVRVLEQVTLLHPLGLRFRDEVTQSYAEYLAVSAYPAANPGLRVDALPNRTGVYSFHGLPGLRDLESGAGDDAFWTTNPPSRPFTVEVQDPERRFLPFQWTLGVPQRGIYRFPGVATELAPFVPLFSTPSRAICTSLAAIRAELYDVVNHGPARWAVVDAQVGELPAARGIADEQGRVLIPIPYPEPRNFGLGSPLRPAGQQLKDQTWPVTIQVRYTPSLVGGLPDLSRLLLQGPATVLADDASMEPFPAATLVFGRELILRSRHMAASPPGPLSVLLIMPAGSPPYPQGGN